MNPAEIESWPIPGLTFVRVDGVSRSFELEQEEQQRRQSPHTNDSDGLARRRYLMEDALTGLSRQNVYLAHLVLGNIAGVNYFWGLSLQIAPEVLEERQLDEVCYDIQKSILRGVYNGAEINKTIFSAADLRAKIAPLATNVGIVTGIASLTSGADEGSDSEQLERIATGLQGLDFGMLILAAPVPSKLLSEEEEEEELSMFDQVTENEDGGLWQVGVYFFAPGADVFLRMQSLIKATYADEGSRPAPLQTHVIAGLQEHLLNFGLLRNHRSDLSSHRLLQYKFLTPLNSRMLSAYIHLPKRDMPGFRVRRV